MSSEAARKANKMLGITKRGTKNKGENRIKPLCKPLMHLTFWSLICEVFSRPEKRCSEGRVKVSELWNKERTNKQNRKKSLEKKRLVRGNKQEFCKTKSNKTWHME